MAKIQNFKLKMADAILEKSFLTIFDHNSAKFCTMTQKTDINHGRLLQISNF